jgi:hypothetical protein
MLKEGGVGGNVCTRVYVNMFNECFNMGLTYKIGRKDNNNFNNARVKIKNIFYFFY